MRQARSLIPQPGSPQPPTPLKESSPVNQIDLPDSSSKYNPAACCGWVIHFRSEQEKTLFCVGTISISMVIFVNFYSDLGNFYNSVTILQDNSIERSVFHDILRKWSIQRKISKLVSVELHWFAMKGCVLDDVDPVRSSRVNGKTTSQNWSGGTP
jgi:hypothetical protein